MISLVTPERHIDARACAFLQLPWYADPRLLFHSLREIVLKSVELNSACRGINSQNGSQKEMSLFLFTLTFTEAMLRLILGVPEFTPTEEVKPLVKIRGDTATPKIIHTVHGLSLQCLSYLEVFNFGLQALVF